MRHRKSHLSRWFFRVRMTLRKRSFRQGVEKAEHIFEELAPRKCEAYTESVRLKELELGLVLI